MEDVYLFISQHWVGWLFSLLSFMVGYLYSKIQRLIKKMTATEEGIKALLRDCIIKSYNKCMERGYCLIYELENIEEMYKQYHALHGNGTVTELVEKIKELPTMPPQHHDEHCNVHNIQHLGGE